MTVPPRNKLRLFVYFLERTQYFLRGVQTDVERGTQVEGVEGAARRDHAAARFSGHGSAMAQAYNHMIMPLASERDRITQVRWGIADFKRVYRSKDLASAESIIFAATGVTDGTLMRGVRFFGDGIRTSSVVMQTNPHVIRFIDTIHVNSNDRNVKIQF